MPDLCGALNDSFQVSLPGYLRVSVSNSSVRTRKYQSTLTLKFRSFDKNIYYYYVCIPVQFHTNRLFFSRTNNIKGHSATSYLIRSSADSWVDSHTHVERGARPVIPTGAVKLPSAKQDARQGCPGCP